MVPRAFPFLARDGRPGIIREARGRDARACLAITNEAIRERPRTLGVVEEELWSAREWRRHRLSWGPRGVTLVAELGGVVAGTLGVVRGPRAATRHTSEFGLTVASGARGAGVGRALIEAAEAWAREHGVVRMTLAVFASSERARRLYSKMGYTEEGRERGGVRFFDVSVDVVRMVKFLDEPVSPPP